MKQQTRGGSSQHPSFFAPPAHPLTAPVARVCCSRDKWAALAEPVEVFHFDFRDFERNMQPASTQLSLRFTQVCVWRG